MPRKTLAAALIPTTGVASIPYPTIREVIQKYGQCFTETFSVELTGAGGVGASFVCPFEPMEVEIYVPATPLGQKSFTKANGTRAGVNFITCAAAAATETITAVSATDPLQGFTVAVPVGILPNAAVANVICRGFLPGTGL